MIAAPAWVVSPVALRLPTVLVAGIEPSGQEDR